MATCETCGFIVAGPCAGAWNCPSFAARSARMQSAMLANGSKPDLSDFREPMCPYDGQTVIGGPAIVPDIGSASGFRVSQIHDRSALMGRAGPSLQG